MSILSLAFRFRLGEGRRNRFHGAVTVGALLFIDRNVDCTTVWTLEQR